MTTPYNPYAPPAAPPPIPGFAGGVDEVAIRREHLGTESGLLSFGILYLISGVLSILFALVGIFFGLVDRSGALGQSGEPAGFLFFAMFASLGLLASVGLWLGLGLRRLDPRVRVPVTLLAAIGLLGFPLGTIINLYLLFLLHGEKGKYVFTPAYREIIARTPQLRPKPGILVWLTLGLIFLVLVAFAIAFFVGN